MALLKLMSLFLFSVPAVTASFDASFWTFAAQTLLFPQQVPSTRPARDIARLGVSHAPQASLVDTNRNATTASNPFDKCSGTGSGGQGGAMNWCMALFNNVLKDAPINGCPLGYCTKIIKNECPKRPDDDAWLEACCDRLETSFRNAAVPQDGMSIEDAATVLLLFTATAASAMFGNLGHVWVMAGSTHTTNVANLVGFCGNQMVKAAVKYHQGDHYTNAEVGTAAVSAVALLGADGLGMVDISGHANGLDQATIDQLNAGDLGPEFLANAEGQLEGNIVDYGSDAFGQMAGEYADLQKLEKAKAGTGVWLLPLIKYSQQLVTSEAFQTAYPEGHDCSAKNLHDYIETKVTEAEAEFAAKANEQQKKLIAYEKAREAKSKALINALSPVAWYEGLSRMMGVEDGHHVVNGKIVD